MLDWDSSLRIIPTRVGTSHLLIKRCQRYRDHPHACGDKICKASDMTRTSGSSPRVWGQVAQINSLEKEDRIIPTRVGTSFVLVCLYQYRWDHPHACGDKKSFGAMCSSYIGSSPRVWGQVFHASSNPFALGIIPTRVGTRHLRPWGCGNWKDHPHACGDKYSMHNAI